LGRLRRASDARIVLDPQYAPSALSLGAAGPVPGLLRSILESLVAKSSTLAEQNRQRGSGMVEFGSGNVGNFWLLHTVNTYIPLVAHLQSVADTHPLALYRTLAQLAGSLCTFSFKLHPRDVPGYDHRDLGGTFGELTRMILELLETVMPSAYTNIALTQRDATMLIGEIAEEAILAGECHLFLAVAGNLAESRVRDEVPSQVIIGAPHNIDFLVKTATPGLSLVHTPVPPRDFPLKAGHTYFKLEADGDTWETVRESRSIAIYLGGIELRNCQYQLIAMR
jgi:type VI secretion system protein ImpJ